LYDEFWASQRAVEGRAAINLREDWLEYPRNGDPQKPAKKTSPHLKLGQMGRWNFNQE
jgi:hypothetical protein